MFLHQDQVQVELKENIVYNLFGKKQASAHPF